MGTLFLFIALLLFALPALMFAVLYAQVVRRGRGLHLLVRDGVETTGRVVNRAKGLSIRQKQVRYEYRDAAGRVHTGYSAVAWQFWEDHAEDGPIAVVYSARRPEISAPRFLVEQTRAALANSASRARLP
jgi:UDP-N-acetylmuramyl tripeptide synthase